MNEPAKIDRARVNLRASDLQVGESLNIAKDDVVVHSDMSVYVNKYATDSVRSHVTVTRHEDGLHLSHSDTTKFRRSNVDTTRAADLLPIVALSVADSKSGKVVVHGD